MRLGKKIGVIDFGIDDKGTSAKVKQIWVYTAEKSDDSVYVVQYRLSPSYHNPGTWLGAIIGVVMGILIGTAFNNWLAIIFMLNLMVPLLAIGGSVLFHWRGITGESDWVIVPMDYKLLEIDGKRIIPVRNGEPVPYLQIDGKYPKISMAAIKLAAKKHLYASEIKHLKQSNVGIILIVIMVVVVLAGAVYMITSRKTAPVPAPTANVTQNVTPGTPIITGQVVP